MRKSAQGSEDMRKWRVRGIHLGYFGGSCFHRVVPYSKVLVLLFDVFCFF